MATQSKPTFDEDSFDLIAHKKAATSHTQAKAHVKRIRLKVTVGRIIVTIAAFAVCALLYFMASTIAAGMF